jgi:hypothetical protein
VTRAWMRRAREWAFSASDSPGRAGVRRLWGCMSIRPAQTLPGGDGNRIHTVPPKRDWRVGLSLLTLTAGALIPAPPVMGQDSAGHVKPLGDEPVEPADPEALERLLSELRAEQDPKQKLATDAQARATAERRLPDSLGPLPRDRGKGWRLGSELFGQQSTKAGLGGIGGRLDTRRIGAGFSAAKSGAPGSLWRFDYSYESSTYNFKQAGPVVPNSNDPVGDLFRNELGLSRFHLPRDEWGYFARMGVAQGMELEAELGDSLVYSVVGALNIPTSPNFAWNLGAFVQSELEGNLLIVPVLGVDWQINALTRLRTVGPGLELMHAISDESRLFTRALFRSRDYRLDDQGPLPGGIFEDRELLWSFGLDWNPGFDNGWLQSSNARLYTGFTPWRRLEFLNANDEEVSKVDAEAGLVLGLNIQFSW